MNFEKTTGDIAFLRRTDPADITLDDALGMLADLIADVQAETGVSFSRLTTGDNAAMRWISVANVLAGIPVDRMTTELTERSKKKIPALRTRLEEGQKNAREAQRQIESCQVEEVQLKSKLKQYENQVETLRQREESVRELRAQIEELKAQADSLEAVDPRQLEEEREQLCRLTEEKKRIAAEHTEAVFRLNNLTAQLNQLNGELAETQRRTEEVRLQQRRSECALKEKQEELQSVQQKTGEIIRENQRKTDEINAMLQEEVRLQTASGENLERLQQSIEETKQQTAVWAEKVTHQREALAIEQEALRSQEERKNTFDQMTESAKAELADAKECAAETEKQLEALKAQFRAVQIRKEELDKEYGQLQSDKETVDITVRLRTEDIESLREKMVESRAELTKRELALDEAKTEQEAVLAQVKEAADHEQRLRTVAEDLRCELEEIKAKIGSLDSDNSTLGEELAAQTIVLTEQMAEKGGEVQRLNSKITELKNVLSEKNKQLAERTAEKERLEDEIADFQRKQDSLGQLVNQRRESRVDCKARLSALEREQQDLENEIAVYEADIRKYREFLDSSDCEAKRTIIEKYQNLTALYSDGISRLTRTNMPPPASQLAVLQDAYTHQKYHLSKQLKEVEEKLDSLQIDYLNVVDAIEKEVGAL